MWIGSTTKFSKNPSYRFESCPDYQGVIPTRKGVDNRERPVIGIVSSVVARAVTIMLCAWVRLPPIPLTPKNNSYEGNSSNRIANGIVLFAVHFKSEEMKTFQPVKTLTKNKASIGDKFIIEGGERTVARITSQYVYLDNGKYFIKKMFNAWMRIASAVEKRDEQSLIRSKKIDYMMQETSIMRKEAKAIYDEKYRQPAVNRIGEDTSLKLYIVLTGVGNTTKFYFSPTFKATPEDMELSYKSLHGTKYTAFAWGYYIQHQGVIALIGMHSYKERNLSEKRINFALTCLRNDSVNEYQVQVKLYKSMSELLGTNPYNVVKLLSSTNQQPSDSKPKKHWSGLNGEIAQDMVDKGLEQMYQDDDSDFPF